MKKPLCWRACRFSAILFLSILWMGAAGADQSGEALLKKCIVAQNRLQSLQATASIRRSKKGKTAVTQARLTLQKPNKGRLELLNAQNNGKVLVLADGKHITAFIEESNDKTYTTFPLDKRGLNFAAIVTPIGGGTETSFFFDPVTAASALIGKNPKIVGTKTVDNIKCTVVQGKNGAGTVFRIYIGSDGRLRGGSLSDNETTFETQLLKAIYNTKLPSSSFVWVPPKGARRVTTEEFFGGKKAQPKKSRL